MRRATPALCRSRPAEGRLPAPARGWVQCKRHCLDQRPHDPHPEVARYTKAADQERMARDGTAAKSRTETGNGQKSVANSGEKP